MERLFRKQFRYKPVSVHESLDLAGARIAVCPVRIEHDTARTETEYRHKLSGYARLFAQQRHAQGKRASLVSPVTHAFFYLFIARKFKRLKYLSEVQGLAHVYNIN